MATTLEFGSTTVSTTNLVSVIQTGPSTVQANYADGTISIVTGADGLTAISLLTKLKAAFAQWYPAVQ